VTCGICGNDGKTGWGCSHLKNTPMTKQQEPSTESMKIAAELWGQVTSVSDWARALDERYEAGKEDAWQTQRDEEGL
jgi:hypothetical protein